MKIPNKIRIISIDYAIENSKYLDNGDWLELRERENEEKIIDSLAYGINQVIQDNKESLFSLAENEVKEKLAVTKECMEIQKRIYAKRAKLGTR